MSLISRVASALDARFPLVLADSSWDNVGTLIENPKPNASGRILVTIDLTPAVMEECLANNVEVIVAYHPPIFAPMKKLVPDNAKQNIVLNCVLSGASIYSPHTSFDAGKGGLNDWVLEAAGFEFASREPIIASSTLPDGSRPKPGAPPIETGFGRVGQLAAPVALSDIIPNLKARFRVPTLRVAMPGGSAVSAKGIAAGSNFTVRTIAVCAGSGASVFKKLKAPVDLVVSGELSHHDVLALNDQGTAVVLAEHTNSERGFLEDVVAPLLREQFPTSTVILSTNDADPLFVW